jgi:hypothetical protein
MNKILPKNKCAEFFSSMPSFPGRLPLFLGRKEELAGGQLKKGNLCTYPVLVNRIHEMKFG